MFWIGGDLDLVKVGLGAFGLEISPDLVMDLPSKPSCHQHSTPNGCNLYKTTTTQIPGSHSLPRFEDCQVFPNNFGVSIARLSLLLWGTASAGYRTASDR